MNFRVSIKNNKSFPERYTPLFPLLAIVLKFFLNPHGVRAIIFWEISPYNYIHHEITFSPPATPPPISVRVQQ